MKKIEQVYSVENFKKEAHELIDLLSEYLDQSQKGNLKVQNWKEPNDLLDYWRSFEFDRENSRHFFENILHGSVNVHHSQYMGHQISPPAPIAALASFLGSMLNNGMAVYEMGAAGTAIEKLVIEDLNHRIGFDQDKADGLITSGGTLANLTALLSARQVMIEEDVWQNGLQQKLGILVSSEAHYCVDRAARIMGFGSEGVIKVPVDESYRMKVDELDKYLEEAQQKGIKVIAVVGSAPSTSTGMHDDLEAIGQFAQKHQLWFHVDGAHGGAALFSDKYRHYLKGIERADSVVIDGHKMLMTPAIMTFLLFKEKRYAKATFTQKAQYLLESTQEDHWYDIALKSFECTKRMMSIQFYILLQKYGAELFDEFVSTLYDSGKLFSKKIQEHPQFELAVDPDTNIVCFRAFYDHLSEEALNDLNKKIRQKLLEEGDFYIVQTTLNSKVFLRTTIMNPNTQEKDFENLLRRLTELSVSLKSPK
jgi:L-2,4-diaminobutyrate decarboxylase